MSRIIGNAASLQYIEGACNNRLAMIAPVATLQPILSHYTRYFCRLCPLPLQYGGTRGTTSQAGDFICGIPAVKLSIIPSCTVRR